MKIIKKNIHNLVDNGFSYYPKLISKNQINNLFRSFVSSINFYLGKNYTFKNFDDSNLFSIILENHKTNRGLIKFIYNSLPHFSSTINLFEKSKIRNIASSHLKTKSQNLIICEHQFRMDYPQDKKYILKPHQDSPYYPQDASSNQSLVCNISLQNIKKDMGSTILYDQSHKMGVVKYRDKFNKNNLISTQKHINKNQLNKFKKVTLETSPGDVSFYDMKLVHSSGLNITNKLRLSIIARIFNPFHKRFNVFQKKTILLD